MRCPGLATKSELLLPPATGPQLNGIHGLPEQCEQCRHTNYTIYTLFYLSCISPFYRNSIILSSVLFQLLVVSFVVVQLDLFCVACWFVLVFIRL